jgi:indole-3-glycerol phosphate synthase
MSGDFLAHMAQASRERVRRARAECSLAALEARAQRTPPPPPLRLDPRGFDLIAELKLRSPAAGRLRTADEDLSARVAAYARAGACAVSVLTEPRRFDGTLAHLAAASAALAPLAVPAMRKDFLTDPYQVLEARAAGAAGVLLIVRMLSAAELRALISCAREQGLFVLLEAFDREDLARLDELLGALPDTEGLLAGLNCRDLATLEVVPERLIELAPLLPRALPRVAESGIAAAADARRAAAAGYTLALVGSALMRDADPGALAAELLAAGRGAHRT